MKKYLGVVAAVSLTVALYGCQKKLTEKPTSEISEQPLQNGEISITQESPQGGQAAAVNQSALRAGEATGASNTPLLNGSAEGLASSPLESPTTKNIQQALTNAGFYQGKIDGDVGPKTKKAIREFQVRNNLKADGKVGPMTWKKLSEYLNTAQNTTVVNPLAAPAASPATTQSNSD